MAILCGYTRAAVVINQNLTVSEYCSETSKLPGALGLNMVAKGIVVLSIGQMFGKINIINWISFTRFYFLGWVRDYFQSFVLCIHVQSAVMVLVVLTWSVDILINKLCFKHSSANSWQNLHNYLFRFIIIFVINKLWTVCQYKLKRHALTGVLTDMNRQVHMSRYKYSVCCVYICMCTLSLLYIKLYIHIFCKFNLLGRWKQTLIVFTARGLYVYLEIGGEL